MKTILISGGAGYLGTELAINLLKKYKVIVYDILYFPWLFKNKKKIKNYKNLKFIKKNIINVKKEDFSGVDIVCDLNGIPNDPTSELNPKRTWNINYKARLNFAKKARDAKVCRYIFNSTCSVYGFNKKKVFEDSKKNPISTYAKANYKAERKIFNLNNNHFKVNVLRNSTLYGFSNTMRLDLVVNIFVLNLMNKKKIFVDGDGGQYRPFISLKDMCNIYNVLVKNSLLPSFICNLVSFNSKISLIAKKICKILNRDNKLINYKKNLSDKRNYVVGSKNFKKYFGNKFKFSKFEKEIINLKKNLKKYKINYDVNTIRMEFYKKKLF